jgi:hypothetical protein
MGGDVLDDDPLAERGGGAAGAGARADGEALERLQELARQAGSDAAVNAAAVAIDAQHRSEDARSLFFDQPDDAVEHVARGGAARDALEQLEAPPVEGVGRSHPGYGRITVPSRRRVVPQE